MRRQWVMLSVMGLVLTACGGGDPAAEGEPTDEQASTAGADIDPCSLIKAAEMTAITTDAVTATDRQDQTCHYRSNPNDGLQLTVRRTGGRKAMKTVRDTARLLGGMGASVADQGGAGKDVEGLLKPDTSTPPALGEEAAWGMNDALSVRQGDAFVEVTPPLMHDPANHPGYPIIGKDEKRKIAVAVARLALQRMGS
jgi:hypothetical protein